MWSEYLETPVEFDVQDGKGGLVEGTLRWHITGNMHPETHKWDNVAARLVGGTIDGDTLDSDAIVWYIGNHSRRLVEQRIIDYALEGRLAEVGRLL